MSRRTPCWDPGSIGCNNDGKRPEELCLNLSSVTYVDKQLEVVEVWFFSGELGMVSIWRLMRTILYLGCPSQCPGISRSSADGSAWFIGAGKAEQQVHGSHRSCSWEVKNRQEVSSSFDISNPLSDPVLPTGSTS